MAKKLPPVHPGEVLREEFLRPLNLSPYAVARAVGVPRTRIERLANEQTPVTADTALRLGRYFGTPAAFWMGIQTQYDLEQAEDELGATLRKIAPAREAKPAASGGHPRQRTNGNRRHDRRFENLRNCEHCIIAPRRINSARSSSAVARATSVRSVPKTWVTSEAICKGFEPAPATR